MTLYSIVIEKIRTGFSTSDHINTFHYNIIFTQRERIKFLQEKNLTEIEYLTTDFFLSIKRKKKSVFILVSSLLFLWLPFLRSTFLQGSASGHTIPLITSVPETKEI